MKRRIEKLKAREILDSRANPTIEVQLETKDEVFLASVPSGVSVGKYEALELRDGGKRYKGKGVLKAVKNINEIIAPKIKGEDPTKQEKIDKLMIKLDGTENKSKLGANAILAVSLAVCRAGAETERIPLWKYISKLAGTKPALPLISVLVVEGGAHAGNELDLQEFMLVPLAGTFAEKFHLAKKIYQELGNILKCETGYEGGFAPSLEKTTEALNLIAKAIDNRQVKIAIDAAASSFYSKAEYSFEGRAFTKEELLDFYSDLLRKYPIVSLEDPFAEEDWEGFQAIVRQLGGKITIIGDDLLATNINRIKEAQKKKACNGLLLKPNQVGTVIETLEAAKLAKSYGWKIMVSHRAGETKDEFIADLAVGLGADFIKSGGPFKPERRAKYNRLLKIEEEIKK